MPGPGKPGRDSLDGTNFAGYGIHGTNAPKSIGKAASHGCIRMAKADLEELYNQVAVGDTVELIGQRNEETAAVFGSGPAFVASSQTSLPRPFRPGTHSHHSEVNLLRRYGRERSGLWGGCQ